MKAAGFLAIVLMFGLPWSLCRADEPAPPSLIISAEVVEVGDPPKSSEFPFQLVRYRVADVCEGSYDKHEILVYHLVKPEGLKDIKPGDHLCLGLIKALGLENEKEGKPPKGLVTAYVDRNIFIRRCQCSSH